MRTIKFDFQGWPVSALTLKEFLKDLGLKCDGDKISGTISENVLNAYPILLEDDGMGYGVNEQYITEVDITHIREDKKLKVPVINIFREKYSPELIKRQIKNSINSQCEIFHASLASSISEVQKLYSNIIEQKLIDEAIKEYCNENNNYETN